MSNFNIPYLIERDGQIEFFNNYRISTDNDDSVLVDYTDGVYNGNIFEFKLNINNLNKTLFQAIKYLSKLRIKGQSVPATILLIDLNLTTAYVFKSIDYKNDIQKVYSGASSRDNDNFVSKPYLEKLDYSKIEDSAKLKKILKGRKKYPDELYMPIDIDENCIIGWASRYYAENPKANKGEFLGDESGTAVNIKGEIRQPRYFKGLINPYKGKTNEKFKYLMDCLNDKLSKKDLGAFYTPMLYAKKAAELVLRAVNDIPDGNDYIILDRCAGTGNLESALVGINDKNGDELIEHCVVSTYEYYEYKVLEERIGDKVRDIIPPSEANVIYENGKVANADALSEDFLNNPIIRSYIDNPKCTVILFENPPYQDSSAITYNEEDGTRGRTQRKETYICKKYKEALETFNESKGSFREISNLFIWSGFQYFLRQPSDAYVVFSPIKYWKTIGLGEKKFESGFLFNRYHFHATESTISCILWKNIPDSVEQLVLEPYDIKDGKTEQLKPVTVRKVHKTFIPFYDKRKFSDDVESVNYCGRDGELDLAHKKDGQSIDNDNIIAYVRTINYSPDAMNRIMTRQMYFGARGYYLRSDNYLTKLPLFAAKLVPFDFWYEKDLYYNSSDGGDKYTKDKEFLKSCFIFVCLSNQNKCLSFNGIDRHYYRNELCFDNGTLASNELRNFAIDSDEKELLEIWHNVLNEAKKSELYNPKYSYGVYQISKQLNTFQKTGIGRKQKKIYDNPILNGFLETLKVKLKIYYKTHIFNKMFQYELIK